MTTVTELLNVYSVAAALVVVRERRAREGGEVKPKRSMSGVAEPQPNRCARLRKSQDSNHARTGFSHKEVSYRKSTYTDTGTQMQKWFDLAT